MDRTSRDTPARAARRPRSLTWLVVAAALATMAVFLISTNAVRADETEAAASLAGFAPLSDTPLPLVALLLLGAAWGTGAYLIRRHG